MRYNMLLVIPIVTSLSIDMIWYFTSSVHVVRYCGNDMSFQLLLL